MVNVVKALNPETLCVHWWNGHKLSKEYTNNMNEPVDCTMTRLVQLMSNGII